MSAAWISCPPNLIPAPGQYLLAHADGSDAPLPASVFAADSRLDAFLAAPPLPAGWIPGTRLRLRGPLGRGFSIPAKARRVALASWTQNGARLLPLIRTALKQEAAITLLSDNPADELPLQIEIQPLSALADITRWADYLAMEVERENLPELKEKLGMLDQARVQFEAQVLVSTPVACGGAAECGVCALQVNHGWRLACREGPVFDLRDLI